MLRMLAFLFCFAFVYPVWSNPSEEIGKATYYADRLHGRKTASGEKYDRKMLTCAHKKYPFGTVLRVTNLDNQESVIVRVNDRGPFVEGYVVDLSHRAAQALDMVEKGVAKVRVEKVEDKEIPVGDAAEEEVAVGDVASFYNDKYQGAKTKSGEKYDRNQLTCANNQHPLGTTLRVTNLKNNKSVVVKINDRLNAGSKSTVDLSRRAAETIDMIDAGRVPVRLEVIPDEKAVAAPRPEVRTVTVEKTDAPKVVVLKPAKEETPTLQKTADKGGATKEKEAVKPTQYAEVTGKDFKSSDLYAISIKRPQKKGFAVQVATFSNSAAILREVAKLQGTWKDKVMVEVENADVEALSTYKLMVGPFADRKAADQTKVAAGKKGYPKCFVVDLSELK